MGDTLSRATHGSRILLDAAARPAAPLGVRPLVVSSGGEARFLSQTGIPAGGGSLSGRGLAGGSEMREGAPYAILTLVPILTVAAALAVKRYRAGRAEAIRGPQLLFAELCRQHSIDAAGQRLLKRIAAGANLSQPAEMFLFPSRFDAAAAAATGLRPEQGEKVSRIRQQLFGPEAEELPSATTSSSSCPFPRSLPS